MDFELIENSFYPSMLMVLNQMESNPKDDEVAFLLSSSKPFFSFPTIMYKFWYSLAIQYTEASHKVYAFQNGENTLSLRYNIQSNNNQVEYFTYGEKLLYFKTKICISINPRDCGSSFIANDGSDLASIYGFTENNLNVEIYYGTTASKVIGLHNINVPGISISLIFSSKDQTASKIKVMFPENGSIIKKFEAQGFDNCGFDGNINFNCQRLVLNKMSSGDTYVANFENCGSVESDVNSISCFDLYHVKNLTLVISKKIEIQYYDSLFSSNIGFLFLENIDNLTLIGSDFTINNLATSFNGFYIVLSKEGTLKFTGNWDNEVINPLKVIGNDFKATVYINQPKISSSINLDDVKYTLMLDYDKKAIILIYNVSNDLSDLITTDYSFHVSMWEENISELLGFYDSFIIYQDNMFDNILLTIDLDLFGGKQVTFAPFLVDLIPDVPHLTLNVIPPNSSSRFSSFIFRKINLLFHTAEKIYFNHIKLDASVINSNNHDISTNLMECSPENLIGWSSLKINEKIILFGSFPEESFTVEFDLITENIEDCLTFEFFDEITTFVFYDNSIKIKNGTFTFPKIKNSYLLIRPNLESPLFHELHFICDSLSAQVPYCRVFYPADVLMFSHLFFEGGWEKVDHYFDINSFMTVSICLDSYITLDVYAMALLEIIANSPSCGINGFSCCRVDFSSETGSYEYVVSTKLSEDVVANITIKEFRIVDQIDSYPHFFFPITFDSQNIYFNILNLNNLFPVKQSLAMVFYMGTESVSTCMIHEYHSIEISDLLIIEMDITGPLRNETEYRILRENMTIITMPASDALGMTPLVMPAGGGDITHSFAFIMMTDTKTDGNYTSIYFYSITKPSLYPYKFFWNPNMLPDLEYAYSECLLIPEQFENCFLSLSEFLQTISIEISAPIDPPYFFYLSHFNERFSRINMTIFSDDYMKSYPNKTLSFDEPGDSLEELHLSKLDLVGERNITFGSVKTLEIYDCTFSDGFLGSEIRNIEKLMIDFGSLMDILQKSHLDTENVDIIITNVHYVCFTDTGWEIKRNRDDVPFIINKNDFKSIKLGTSNMIDLRLNQGRNTRKINYIEIELIGDQESSSVVVNLGEGWEKLENFDGLKLKTNGMIYLLTVASVSVPIPDIFPDDVKISKLFNPLYHNQFYISDTKILNEPIEFDLVSFPESQQVIKGHKIMTSGLTTLTFKDNIGSVDSDDITLLDGTSFTGSNILSRNLIKAHPKSNSNLEFIKFTSDSVIEIHWEQNSWPSLLISKLTDDDPKLIKVILDDTRPSHDLYYEFTYRKSFIASKEIENFKYAINKANSWIKQQNPKFNIEDLIPQILSQLKKKQ